MKKKMTFLTLLSLLSLPIFAQNIFNAAQTNDIAGIKFLLNRNVSIDSRNAEGQTALIVAVKSGQTRAADLLVEKDANIDLQDNAGNTALIDAVSSGNAAMIKTLIDHGANPKLKNKENKTAADYANASKDPAIITLVTAAL